MSKLVTLGRTDLLDSETGAVKQTWYWPMAEVNGELIRTPRPLGTEEAARDWAANL